MVPETLGKTSFWLMLIGSNLFYFTQMMVGVVGMPRRYADYPRIPEWITLNEVQTVGPAVPPRIPGCTTHKEFRPVAPVPRAAGSLIVELAGWGGLKAPQAERDPWG